MGDSPGSQDVLRAPLTIGYDFQRTTGPVIGAFLTGLRDADGAGDPRHGRPGGLPAGRVRPRPRAHPLTEMVEVGTEGTVTSWSWVANVREGQPLQTPHALALIQLDGADTSMLHVGRRTRSRRDVDRRPGPDPLGRGTRGPHRATSPVSS